MPITKDVSNVIQYELKKDKYNFDQFGVVQSSQFAVADDNDVLKQAKFSTSDLPTNTTITLKIPNADGTIALAGGGAVPSFVTIQVPAGTSPVATGPNDTLTLLNGAGIAISGDSTTDEITISFDKATSSLSNVDNTSDASKPISTATQTALNAKAPLASPALTGTPTAPTADAGTNTTQVANTAFVTAAIAQGNALFNYSNFK